MAIFKVLKGDSSRIDLTNTPFHEGWAYFTPDDGGFYVDTIVNEQEKRIRITSGRKDFYTNLRWIRQEMLDLSLNENSTLADILGDEFDVVTRVFSTGEIDFSSWPDLVDSNGDRVDIDGARLDENGDYIYHQNENGEHCAPLIINNAVVASFTGSQKLSEVLDVFRTIDMCAYLNDNSLCVSYNNGDVVFGNGLAKRLFDTNRAYENCVQQKLGDAIPSFNWENSVQLRLGGANTNSSFTKNLRVNDFITRVNRSASSTPGAIIYNEDTGAFEYRKKTSDGSQGELLNTDDLYISVGSDPTQKVLFTDVFNTIPQRGIKRDYLHIPMLSVTGKITVDGNMHISGSGTVEGELSVERDAVNPMNVPSLSQVQRMFGDADYDTNGHWSAFEDPVNRALGHDFSGAWEKITDIRTIPLRYLYYNKLSNDVTYKIVVLGQTSNSEYNEETEVWEDTYTYDSYEVCEISSSMTLDDVVSALNNASGSVTHSISYNDTTGVYDWSIDIPHDEYEYYAFDTSKSIPTKEELFAIFNGNIDSVDSDLADYISNSYLTGFVNAFESKHGPLFGHIYYFDDVTSRGQEGVDLGIFSAGEATVSVDAINGLVVSYNSEQESWKHSRAYDVENALDLHKLPCPMSGPELIGYDVVTIPLGVPDGFDGCTINNTYLSIFSDGRIRYSYADIYPSGRKDNPVGLLGAIRMLNEKVADLKDQVGEEGAPGGMHIGYNNSGTEQLRDTLLYFDLTWTTNEDEEEVATISVGWDNNVIPLREFKSTETIADLIQAINSIDPIGNGEVDDNFRNSYYASGLRRAYIDEETGTAMIPNVSIIDSKDDTGYDLPEDINDRFGWVLGENYDAFMVNKTNVFISNLFIIPGTDTTQKIPYSEFFNYQKHSGGYSGLYSSINDVRETVDETDRKVASVINDVDSLKNIVGEEIGELPRLSGKITYGYETIGDVLSDVDWQPDENEEYGCEMSIKFSTDGSTENEHITSIGRIMQSASCEEFVDEIRNRNSSTSDGTDDYVDRYESFISAIGFDNSENAIKNLYSVVNDNGYDEGSGTYSNPYAMVDANDDVEPVFLDYINLVAGEISIPFSSLFSFQIMNAERDYSGIRGEIKDHEHRISNLENNMSVDAIVAKAKPIVTSFTLFSSGFTGNGPYTYTVPYTETPIDEYSDEVTKSFSQTAKYDIQPDATVINQMITDKITALYTVNNGDDGLQFVAVGGKPSVDLTVQTTATEVTV